MLSDLQIHCFIFTEIVYFVQNENDYSMLVAVPCGRDHVEILQQTNHLRTGFINYLQQKQAAGIVNVSTPDQSQVLYTNNILSLPHCGKSELYKDTP